MYEPTNAQNDTKELTRMRAVSKYPGGESMSVMILMATGVSAMTAASAADIIIHDLDGVFAWNSLTKYPNIENPEYMDGVVSILTSQ